MKIANLNIEYGDKKIFSDFGIEFEKNKVTAILGSSGIGKTTILRAISSLVDYSGEISEVGKISYVFQESRLIPTMTVKQNLLYVAQSNKEEFWEKAKVLLDKYGLAEEENTFPDELSGGMASRVGLIRAFLTESDTILLDEPFRFLDAKTREKLIKIVAELLVDYKRTAILVTHEPKESITLADRIIVLGDRPAKVIMDVEVKKDLSDLEKLELEKKLLSAI